ncbi:MAG TPA: CAP domain-containing protein [Patescibacteria group bacterium]|nr:CAP domain-containing protein [Patescibacteria group bacterium]
MAIATRSKAPAHHKKVVGKHHKPNKHYMKAYFPYLPLVGIVAIGLTVSSLLGGPGNVLGSQADMSSASLLAGTNTERQADNETSLSLNTELAAAAQSKADDMVAKNYWSHESPDGKTPWTFMAAAGYTYETAGENLAYGFSQADDVVKGWMNSTEHRANILDANYQDVGFGVASSPNFNNSGPETIVVAMYGQPYTGSVADIKFRVQQTSPASNVLGATSPVASQPVSRIGILLANSKADWTVTAVSLVATFAAVAFLLRHALAWRRVLSRGELFVVRHPWLDASFVTAATLGYVLTRAAGIIG